MSYLVIVLRDFTSCQFTLVWLLRVHNKFHQICIFIIKVSKQSITLFLWILEKNITTKAVQAWYAYKYRPIFKNQK